jgi:hypothetical protein
LTAEGLRGRVVLVQFWTYTCINWLRTLSHVRAWAETYQDDGLVVVGVHTPEFGFEREVDNVRLACARLGVEYPVALDSGYRVWQAFDNHYWPALYFVDARGQVRHHHFGEGQYAESELVLRQLLAEAGATGVGDRHPVAVVAGGIEAAADWRSLRSPEKYTGYARTDSFASPAGILRDEPRTYSLPEFLSLNSWALEGTWAVAGEASILHGPGGRLACAFHARDLHLVMGPSERGVVVRFRVLIDGQPPTSAHGLDVDEEGFGVLREQRLYNLIRQQPPIGVRRFEIEFLDAGAEAYALTFG